MGFARRFFLRELPGGEYHLILRDWGTNQIALKALFTCVVYTNGNDSDNDSGNDSDNDSDTDTW